ncbi:MAG: bifunctional proline dehydrogenase/L-glutamate gamma-semialdehyde dehydrogenase PutA [Steroidobacteraceae bacterium]
MSAEPVIDPTLANLRQTLRDHTLISEHSAVLASRRQIGLPAEALSAPTKLARELVAGARARADERTYFDAFLQEFGLSNREGIALMSLAESLLRVPDNATADKLIREKLASGDWSAHSNGSQSGFVNASTWGLALAGRLLGSDEAGDQNEFLRNVARRLGEPVVRQAMRRAMKLMGGEFVVGRTIEEALQRSQKESRLKLCSFDMLGEGARTESDAWRYFKAYQHAIATIGAQIGGRSIESAHSISIKLSALDCVYSRTKGASVHERLIPRALDLARQAAKLGVGLTIDAEEADRLDISLDVIEALILDSATHQWPGLGLAVQAYGKRAGDAIDLVVQLARTVNRRMTIRLVKGAYWDSEIKRAQERGLADYPVFTSKLHTDVSYLACATRLFAAADVIYPQFATHNAMTIAALLHLRPTGCAFEFQRLHGMGELLYSEAQAKIDKFPPVRVYAPVGAHEDLLAYLVRRLLENGANTSFVNRFMDPRLSVDEVVENPLAALETIEGTLPMSESSPSPASNIPLPGNLYRNDRHARKNSRGVDFGNPLEVAELLSYVRKGRAVKYVAGPIIGGVTADGVQVEVHNPALHSEIVGTTRNASETEIRSAFDRAAAAYPAWDRLGGTARGALLERTADLIEEHRAPLTDLLVREAGKTLNDTVAEIREAADFLRYYAVLAREQFVDPTQLTGPTGERNTLSLHGRGVFACISPWNFPLAIFIGQVSAALAAGNAVVAKPAAPTTLVAAAAVRLMHEAGIPVDVLQFVPAEGRVFGEVAFKHPALAGVALTGSTATANTINRMLAAREGAIIPLIAETGGLNVMIADSTALPEQVVDDVMMSAFLSAGQRCSALRLLFVQEDVADRVIEMIVGAMDQLVVGNPAQQETDVGPVINNAAAASLRAHVERMRGTARILKTCAVNDAHTRGTFFPPTLIELSDPRQLKNEEFGPVLHVYRYKAADLEDMLAIIRESEFGLTLGVQTRIDSVWQTIFAGTSVGNTYVNRNMVGAVVGVQPFGGNGLSGTGPKAGGPHYLLRFANERTLTINETATGGNVALLRG